MTGKDVGITVNSIAPVASTRLAGGSDDSASGQGALENSAPSLVSPLVALLCHESCAVSGETFLAGGRRQARVFLAETEGYFHPGAEVTPETVAEHWGEVMDESYYYIPQGTDEWLRGYSARTAASPIVAPG